MGDQPVRPSWDSIADAYKRWMRWKLIERDLTTEELAAALSDWDELAGTFGRNKGAGVERPNSAREGEEP